MAFTYQGTSGGGGSAIETYVESVNGDSGVVTFPFVESVNGDSGVVSLTFVESVNGETGVVSLNASDVGAAADDHIHDITEITNYTEGYDFYIRKTSDTSRASTTTFADDPDFSGIFLPANSVYCMEAWLDFQAGTTPGSKIILGGPAGISARVFYSFAYDGTPSILHYNRQDMFATPELFGGLGNPTAYMRMIVRNGATEGDFAIRWAQHTSDASATVMRKGSFIRGKFF